MATTFFSRENITTFFLALLAISLVFLEKFRALPGLAFGGLFLTATLYRDINYKQVYKNTGPIIFPFYLIIKILLWEGFIKQLPQLFKKEVFFIFSILFFMFLFDFFRVDYINRDEYYSQLVIKIPVFILCFSLCTLPPIDKNRYHIIFYFFIIATTIGTISSFINYLNNYEELTKAYLRSKIIPLPVNHVRFSLIVTFSIACGFFLYIKKYYVFTKYERWGLLIITIFNIAFLHLMSVRSGLLAFYMLVFFAATYIVFNSKYKLKVIPIALLIMLSPLAAYYTIPTFKNKVKNTIEDMDKATQPASANYYSLSKRIYTYKVGYDIWKRNPYLGLGIGNIRTETEKTYIRNFPVIQHFSWAMPHNQYLKYLATFGIVGFVLFMFSFYYPLFAFKALRKDWFLLTQYAIVSLSFLFEATLDTQLGLNYSILFILASMLHHKKAIS